jgi:hypothetical protein
MDFFPVGDLTSLALIVLAVAAIAIVSVIAFRRR